MQNVSKTEKRNGKKIGFVPTMGFLHEGHQELLKQARETNDIVVLSIFVNPLQFGPNEDFDAYPRDFERDEHIAEKLGVDFLFYPSIDEMYPGDRTTVIKVEKRVDVLCGKHRPGHFDGVATVVMKLFQIVQPHYAYFGMKDAQQVAVIEGLVNDYHLDVEIIRVATIREKDGLAKSSRNVYLRSNERQEASRLYHALTIAKEMMVSGKKQEDIKAYVRDSIQQHTSAEMEYVEIYAYPALEKMENLNQHTDIIIAIAAKFSKARLIDNIVFHPTETKQ